MDSNEIAKEVADAATGQASPEVLKKRSAKAMGLPPIVPRTLDFRREESKPAAPRRKRTPSPENPAR